VSKYVYICTVGWDYEGECVQAAYSTLAKARKHRFLGGDTQKIYKARLDSKAEPKLVTDWVTPPPAGRANN
jgi:hypothetical protein